MSINGNNIFCLDAGDDVYLYGTMGSKSQYENVLEVELPWGGDPFKSREHMRIRSVVEDTETSYITLLIPSESATNPITDIIDGDSYYALEIYDTSKQPTEKSYYAVSDTILDVSFDDIDLNSDAGFVGLTYRPGYLYDTKITKFILSEGDSIQYNDTTLVECSSDIYEIIANYSGTELSVVVKSEDVYPQYKILRQGVDPEDFTSIGVEDGENGSNNIQNLWYDDDYFYVNLNEISTCPVYLCSPIYVPEGDTLTISDSVTINCLSSEVKFEIDGEINIGTNVTFTSPDSVHWDGIYLNNSLSEIEIEYLTINRGMLYNNVYTIDISHSEFSSSGIYQTGIEFEISYSDFDSSNVECQRLIPEGQDVYIMSISNCTFENYSDSVLYAIEVSGYSRYSITDNEISDCSGGINVNESGSVALCDISDNTITNNDGNGIVLYHSYGEITGHNDIVDNTIGIVSTHNSPLKVIGTEYTPYQTIKNNAYEEVKFDIDSAPMEEEEIQFAFNRITDESCAGGNDQYLINCIKFDGDARDIVVQYNYWHPTSPEWGEWDGDELFYPDSAFDYIPTWEPKKNGNPSPAGILYNNAEALIKQGKYEDAKTVYKSIINQYPTTEYAIFSIRNLLSVETLFGQDFSSLKQYYLTDQNCNLDYQRTKLSKYLANYCSIKLEDYATAITFFEDIIADPDTELDSLYAVIDAGYTYLLMENSSMYYKGRMTELIPKSIRDFKQKRMALLAGLLEIPETVSGGSTEDYKFSLHQNYPNPFGNSTIISFSLPKNTQKADLKIYNIRGQLVREFDINNKSGIGSITWDGQDSYGKKVGSGIYFYKLSADKKETIKKIVLIR